jgi:molecular chaperone HtpG
MAEKLQKETGDLSIHTENILPIIKKWLYSDHEIFIRELVSNASDAISKLDRLAGLGEFKGDAGAPKIKVAVDKKKKTITISDTGVGMTADEIKKYINQIAFSGAEEFLEKYKQDDEKSQIIGHFGLGFYSAYMVADLVEIHTKSFKDDSPAVHWSCDGSTTYSLEASDKETIGSEIILHVNDDNKEYLEETKIKELLTKYCKYYAVPVVVDEEKEVEIEDKKKKKDDDKADDKPKKTKKVIEEVQINETKPIWTKKPAELKDEDYLNFYRKEYPMKEDPLFWVHINVDFPFNINGILYFPKLKNDFDINKSEISLYCNQVFVTDQTQDLIPEYLHLLQGVIDSNDIPLNVSRSYLQSDNRVKKISGHITKKVADKLKGMFKTEREQFQKYWDDIHPFIKFGMLKDDDFQEKVKDITLIKSTKENYYTLAEYKEKFIATNMNKDKKCVVLYTSDAKQQATYLKAAEDKGYEVVLFDHMIDSHFLSMFEAKNSDYKFTRIDSNTVDKLIDAESEDAKVDEKESEAFQTIFREALSNDKLDVKLENMSDDKTSAIMTMSEESRRMKEMMRMMNPQGESMDDMFGGSTLILNNNNAVVQKIKTLWESDKDKAGMFINHVYDLASLTQKPLEGERLTAFVSRSSEILAELN